MNYCSLGISGISGLSGFQSIFRGGPEGLVYGQGGPGRHQDGPGWAKKLPRSPHDGLRSFQDHPRTIQEASNIVPRLLKKHPR